MTLSFTKNLHLAVPDFLTEPWHAEFAQAMDSIDRILFSAVVAANTTLWTNSHDYIIGDLVIDPDTGGIFSAAVAHTSSPPPTTFTNERLAHPTFWTPFAPVLASQAEAEAGTENTKYMSPLRVAQAIDAQSAAAGLASQAEAEAGTNNTQTMTPLRTAQSVAIRVKVVPQGRLTLLANTPFMGSAVVNGAATIYYTPAVGTLIPIWNGTTFDVVDFLAEIPAQASNSTHNPSVIAGENVYDWFVWVSSSVVTVSIATPAVVTFASHGLAVNHAFQFTTTGTLPSPLAPNTTYYVISTGLTANTFQFSASPGGAAINTSATQAGTHTLVAKRLTHGPAWTNKTTRSLGIIRHRGVWVNNGAIANGPGSTLGTYVGTVQSFNSFFYWRPVAADVQATSVILGVYNAYNRRVVIGTRQEQLGSYVYISGIERLQTATAASTIFWVDGLGESWAKGTQSMLILTDAASNAYLRMYVNHGSYYTKLGFTGSGAGYGAVTAEVNVFPVIGSHNVTANEYGAGTQALFHGATHAMFSLTLEM